MEMAPKRTERVEGRMRSSRRNRRGLAEIVGTLMLVVIVVAAATAFAFFVASYQKQLQAEETLSHDKSLEDLRILGLTPTVGTATPPSLPPITNLRVELASVDPNAIVVDGLTLNGASIVVLTVTNSEGVALGPPGCLNGNPLLPSNATCVLSIPAESQVFLSLDLSTTSPQYAFTNPSAAPILNESSLIVFDMYTSLGNEFTQSFVPPVAIAGITFVDDYPILDGSNSYQPDSGNGSVTVDQWSWNVTCPQSTKCVGANDTGLESGQEVELGAPFTPGAPYTIYLDVTNSDSLVGSTYITYTLVG